MTVFKRTQNWIGALARRAGMAPVVRLHRDERGGMLEYAFVVGFIVMMFILPVWPVGGGRASIFGMLWHVLTDYFGMIAFFVTWPFM